MTVHSVSADRRPASMDQPSDDYSTYLDILRELGSQAAAVNTALIEAHTADTPAACRRALVDLHTRLRHMAATANQALGAGAPAPDTEHG
jgi:hypothetical protein